MELSGSHVYPAPQAVVWRALTDPNALRRCLPGCRQFDPQPDGSYAVTMTIGVAFIKGTYTGTVHMRNERPPHSYTLQITAKGSTGFVNGSGDFTLTPQPGRPDHTVVRYTSQAQVGGKIAAVGQRLVQASAQVVADQFFRAMEKEVIHSMS